MDNLDRKVDITADKVHDQALIAEGKTRLAADKAREDVLDTNETVSDKAEHAWDVTKEKTREAADTIKEKWEEGKDRMREKFD